jgi:cytochrome c553
MNAIFKFILLLVFLLPAVVHAEALEERFASYLQKGAGSFDSAKGQAIWQQGVLHAKSGKTRSCGSCHGNDLTQPGKHVKTGKTIKPMALSANPQRLTDGKKIEKWFKRNCKWTWGRACTAQEKGDILSYLKQL